MQADYSCGARRPADLVFALPSSADTDDTNHALQFFQKMTAEFSHVEDGGVNFGLVPKDCQSVEGFHLKETTGKEDTLEKFQARHHYRPDNAQTLKYLRSTAFKKVNGARDGANRIAVMIVDRNSRDLADTATESFKVREKKDVDLFTIVVGKHVSEEEMKALSGDAIDKRVIWVKRYDQLNSVIDELTIKIQDICH